MRRRRNYIAKMLLGVSIIMLIAMVLPHHHHKQLFCLEQDIESCELPCPDTDQQNTDKKACKDCCITKFICYSPGNSENQVNPEYTFEVLLFTLTDIYTLPVRPQESKVKSNIFYLEELYNSLFASPIGLRAPPQALKLPIKITS